MFSCLFLKKSSLTRHRDDDDEDDAISCFIQSRKNSTGVWVLFDRMKRGLLARVHSLLLQEFVYNFLSLCFVSVYLRNRVFLENMFASIIISFAFLVRANAGTRLCLFNPSLVFIPNEFFRLHETRNFGVK
jgi:hypothetical protein